MTPVARIAVPAPRVSPVWTRPGFWHGVSLVGGLGFILLLQSGQWFFFDEWAFLKVDGPGLFAPHVGHWSTSPLLVFRALRAVFGLHTYLPYATFVTLFHLATAHLLWRIALSAGARTFVATSATCVFILLGSGAENILWAFQIGFIGGLLFGLLSLFLATAPRLSGVRFVAIVATSVFSLTWSGTALPLVVATTMVLLVRHGLRPSATVFGSNLLVYLGWYLTSALHSPGNPDTGGFGLHKLLVAMPEFLGVMIILGFGEAFPAYVLGLPVLIALTIWTIASIRRRGFLSRRVPAFALALAAIVFAMLTAYSRAAQTVGGGRSSRYVYLLVALLVPLSAVALTAALNTRTAVMVGCAALVLLAGYQSTILVGAARTQSAAETGSQHAMSAALWLYAKNPSALNPAASPDPRRAPDIELKDLLALQDAGYIGIGAFTTRDVDIASAALDR